jgi:hypothetical protein
MQRKVWTRLRIKLQLNPTIAEFVRILPWVDAAGVALKNPNQTKKATAEQAVPQRGDKKRCIRNS